MRGEFFRPELRLRAGDHIVVFKVYARARFFIFDQPRFFGVNFLKDLCFPLFFLPGFL